MPNNKFTIEGVFDTKGIVRGVKGANSALNKIGTNSPTKFISNLSSGTQTAVNNVKSFQRAVSKSVDSIRAVSREVRKTVAADGRGKTDRLPSGLANLNVRNPSEVQESKRLFNQRKSLTLGFDNKRKQLFGGLERAYGVDIKRSRRKNFKSKVVELPRDEIVNSKSIDSLKKQLVKSSKAVSKQKDAVSKNTNAVNKNTARSSIAGGGGGSLFGNVNPDRFGGFGGRGLSIYDTALATLGLGLVAQALVVPVAETELNIDRAIGTRPENTSNPNQSFSEIRANFNEKTGELLAKIRKETLDSTISLSEFSQGVTNIYKDGLTVIDTASKNLSVAKNQATSLLQQRFTSGEITQDVFDRSIKQLGDISSFSTNDYITLAAQTASRSARGLSEPESFGKIANVLGDVLPKVIDTPEALSKALADITSGRIERSFVTAVNSSRFDSLEITNALRNTVGIQSRIQSLDTAEILKLIAVFDRIGPSAIRVGTSLRRFTQEITNTAKIKTFQDAGFSKSEGLSIIDTFKNSKNAEDLIKNFVSVLNRVEAIGKTSKSQFAFKLLGTEGDRPASEIIKDTDAILASFTDINKKVKEVNLGNQIALVEENLTSSFRKLVTAYQRLLSSIGLDGGIFSSLMSVFDTISSFFNGLTSAFTKIPLLGSLVGAFISVGVTVFTLTAVVGGLVFAFTRLGSILGLGLLKRIFGFTGALSVMSALPLGLILGPLTALGLFLNKIPSVPFVPLKNVTSFLEKIKSISKSAGKSLIIKGFGVFAIAQFIRSLDTMLPGLSSFSDRFISTTTGMIAGFMLGGPLGAVIGGLVGWMISFTSSSEEMSNAVKSLYETFKSAIDSILNFRASFRQKRNNFLGIDDSETGSFFNIARRESLSNRIDLQKQVIERTQNLIAPGLSEGYTLSDLAAKTGIFGVSEDELLLQRTQRLEELNGTLRDLIRALENAGGEVR